jgi:hypothetical protein
MISSEVQRTLVKSPPELWAELSDPASLARHLGELGEIKITRVEPERTVEWEAADTTGKVLLKASGWGTKVTLTVAREVSAAAIEAEVEPTTKLEVEAKPEAELEAIPDADPLAIVEREPEAIVEPEPAPVVVVEPQARPGFFARLFRRRPREQVPTEPSAEPELTIEPVATEESASPAESESTAEPEPTPGDAPPPPEEPPAEVPDIAAELLVAEEAATAEVTAVLTAVLDRLGAAHHRPFSRA